MKLQNYDDLQALPDAHVHASPQSQSSHAHARLVAGAACSVGCAQAHACAGVQRQGWQSHWSFMGSSWFSVSNDRFLAVPGGRQLNVRASLFSKTSGRRQTCAGRFGSNARNLKIQRRVPRWSKADLRQCSERLASDAATISMF